VNDLFTSLDMDNPLHKEPVDEAEMNGVNVDIQKVLILSAFLHDIGNGGKYYDKPEHEGILI
jgi:metal-dependent HD superfamily phosphatase/phosphodiesterase